MTREEQMAISRRYWEDLFGQGDLAVADEIVTPDWTIHNPGIPESLRGPAGLKQMIQMFRTAFPDIRFAIEDMVVDGDRVVLRLTADATHLGPFMGLAATGRPVTITAMAIDRFADGKLAERWGVLDRLGMLQQVGAIPRAG